MPLSWAYLGVVLIWATTPLAIQWGTMDSNFSFAAKLPPGVWLGAVLIGAGLWLHQRQPNPRERRAPAR